MRRKKKKRLKIKNIIVFILLILIIGVGGYYLYNQIKEDNITKTKENLVDNIKSHYNLYVKTNKETKLYDKDKVVIGKTNKDTNLLLEDIDNITEDNEYFKVKDLEDTYILYSDVDKTDEFIYDDRYKVYIPFNLNIKTKDKTSFYDEDNNFIYEIDKVFDMPVIVKDTDRYGVEYNNQLLYVKSDDVDSTYENHNTDKHNSSGIGVLNYHAFYDENDASERASCTTEICHSKSQFKTHLDYFKEHDMLTVKMKEVEMYIDGKLQLPKSVLITIDDGGMTKIAVDMLTEYKMYATIFLVTSWFNPKDYYTTDYIELHSHSHNMHDTGVCPTGQGGGIQCLSEDKIQEDLKTARELLNNTTYFCYPFYEYNEYSIKMLKQAGFTMAFDGEKSYGDNLVHPGDDKFRLRRFVIVTYTTMRDFDKYFGQIK